MGIVSGAAEGNRTLVIGLGSLCSTIELQPHEEALILQKKVFFSYFLCACQLQLIDVTVLFWFAELTKDLNEDRPHEKTQDRRQ